MNTSITQKFVEKVEDSSIIEACIQNGNVGEIYMTSFNDSVENPEEKIEIKYE
jgi:hypothetical protein